MSFKMFTIEELLNIIMYLKNKDSSGINDATTRVVKFLAQEIVYHLTELFSKSVVNSNFPTILKLAIIIIKAAPSLRLKVAVQFH